MPKALPSNGVNMPTGFREVIEPALHSVSRRCAQEILRIC